MPSFDDILKSAGLGHRVYDDETLGRFTGLGGPWHYKATVDFPFQADVSIDFQLEHDTPQFPASLPKNVMWIQDNLAEIWNGAAAAVTTMIEAEGLEMPEPFAVDRLWLTVPDAPCEHGAWTLGIEPKDTG